MTLYRRWWPRPSPRKRNAKKAKWLSEKALQTAEKRSEVKGKGEQERNIHLNAEFQRIARRVKKAFLSDQCKEIEGNNRMGKTRDLFKKSRDITLPAKVCLVKAMVFPVVMYGCESWTVKKAERPRIDAFELCCWRRLLRVPWTARRSNQSILPSCITDLVPRLWSPKERHLFFPPRLKSPPHLDIFRNHGAQGKRY